MAIDKSILDKAAKLKHQAQQDPIPPYHANDEPTLKRPTVSLSDDLLVHVRDIMRREQKSFAAYIRDCVVKDLERRGVRL